MPIAHILSIYKLTNIVVTGDNKYLIFAAFQVVMPSFKGFHDCEQLMIIGFVENLH